MTLITPVPTDPQNVSLAASRSGGLRRHTADYSGPVSGDYCELPEDCEVRCPILSLRRAAFCLGRRC